MSGDNVTKFAHIYEELKVCKRNLQKDPATRRRDLEVVNRKFAYIDRVKQEFVAASIAFNSIPVKERSQDRASVQQYVDAINTLFDNITKTLQERLAHIQNNEIVTQTSTNMSEKFDLRTASTMLPLMDGTEKTTNQLVDAISLYNSFLDDAGKKLLTTYVLKARLSQSAKLRLEDAYDSNEDLIADIKKHCIAPKSAAAISVKLNSARQGGRSLQEFGGYIENLFRDLTLAQAEGNSASMKVLKQSNEKLSIHAYANGLRDPELRTIVKARNVGSLAEAIRISLDEKSNAPQEHEINHFGNRGRYSRGMRYIGRRNFSENRNANGNYYYHNQNLSRNNRGFNNRGFRGQFRTRAYSRGSVNHRGQFRGNNHRLHVVTEEASNDTDSTFFREPRANNSPNQ